MSLAEVCQDIWRGDVDSIYFGHPRRVFFHLVTRAVRALSAPLVQLILGMIVKRAFGLNKPGSSSTFWQSVLLRRDLNSTLLSQTKLISAFAILGSHYEGVSASYFTPISLLSSGFSGVDEMTEDGIDCPDPELLEIAKNVVFGSRSQFFTVDRDEAAKITVGDGAMVADRVVLFPGPRIGRRIVMGSGALAKRDTFYPDGSTWIGCEMGEAVCLDRGPKEKEDLAGDMITPFGRAFYECKANFWVFPYVLLLCINIFGIATSTAYWSVCAVSTAQVLQQLDIYLPQFRLFDSRWYEFSIVYLIVAVLFVVVLTLQAIIALLWVIATKWIVIGRRKPGGYD
ncbi:hypothetical protein C8J56DRAFT_1082003 [Mycena floridula]|nr:hypothetical protein C8J56DRAFT_1082003 [Mycena floridula]